MNCFNLEGAILLQLLFRLRITVLFNLDGHKLFECVFLHNLNNPFNKSLLLLLL